MRTEHPDYLLLKQRDPRLAFLWRIGQVGRRLGIIGAFTAPTAILIAAFLLQHYYESPIRWWAALLTATISFTGFTGVVVLSVILMAYARKRGSTYDFSRESE